MPTVKELPLQTVLHQIEHAADESSHRPLSLALDAQFVGDDGVEYGRAGRWIVVGDRRYRLTTSTHARQFFSRLTLATS